jgi:hypothetical protein
MGLSHSGLAALPAFDGHGENELALFMDIGAGLPLQF